MNFDLYYPMRVNREGKDTLVPGINPVSRSIDDILVVMNNSNHSALIEKIRSGHKELKIQLPAVTWCGTCSGTRKLENMAPTQLVMIDIDHCNGNMTELMDNLSRQLKADEDFMSRLFLLHITPSGHGIRIVFFAWEDLHTLPDNMERARERFHLEEYGEYDAPVHDISRLSFLPCKEDIWYLNGDLTIEKMNYKEPPITNDYSEETPKKTKSSKPKDCDITEEDMEYFDSFEYRGTPIGIIVESYVKKYGSPSSGEVHNYYNEMVKNFRCICDNNKKLLLYVLPKFGHTDEECWSQIKSICRVNTLSSLPKPFYFFLKDSGFYKGEERQTALKNYMLSEEETNLSMPPYLPPVFRELMRIAPKDFVFPVLDALLPILGTLTSYVKARYPYDDRWHTTSFFTVIYAPPGTGKSFVERFMDLLFCDLKVRDFVQSERERIYLRALNRKSQNDKAPDRPCTSLRLIPAKNSESEFLEKQQDNHGYHMFTFAAEMDSWAKGVKAAGGNKDDMIRIAWDNGEYGQAFKSPSTFKGTVQLYWNVLITGTLQQVEKYFKDVENGLVTRCGFTGIDNQEFCEPPVWKKLSKRDLQTIRNFTLRCDRMTYMEPCTILPEELAYISDEDFDKEINWKFQFRERKEVDCSWIMPTIEKFHAEQVRLAALDLDKARDVFRRRVAVRGFRLALLCTCLWEKPTKSQLANCTKFIDWYMHNDLDRIMQLWAHRYNAISDTTPNLSQRSVYSDLGESFSRSDVYTVCLKQGIKTPVRKIIHDWKKLGYIMVIDKEHLKKIKK